MVSRWRVRFRWLAVLLVVLSPLTGWLASPPAAQAISPSIVISQVYGGGGNSDATYTHDFIELFNRGATVVSLAGWSLQYASDTGTGHFGATATQLTELPAVSLAPGQYFLIQEAQGSGGTTPLPTPDLVDATPIALGATGGKVALVNTIAPLGCNGGSTPCSPAALATIVDLVGYGGANFFEGAGSAPAPGNTTAVVRRVGGCVETDTNSADFLAGAPDPRTSASLLNPCPVVASCPATLNTITGTSVSGLVSATDADGTVINGLINSITPATAGISLTGFTPAAGVGGTATATLTVDATTLNGSYEVLVTFTNNDPTPETGTCLTRVTVAPATPIREIQGSTHRSPKAGQTVVNVPGIVTAKVTNGFFMQDPLPDANDATSEGIFVFTASAPSVTVGDAVVVGGTVTEFRPGGVTSTNLTTTEITAPTITVTSSGNSLPAPVMIGTGGRVPPATVIEDDATGDVETSGLFDPSTDGIDFYESLEGMRVQVNQAVAVGPTSAFGEIPILADDGAGATVRTVRGGIVIRPTGSNTDFNPERIILDDAITSPLPVVHVGDHFSGPVIGVLDYSFGNFKLLVTAPLTSVPGGLAREVTTAPLARQLTLATFNLANLDPADATINALASTIVTNLKAPDIVAVQEVQDNNGPTNNGEVDASLTFTTLITAIQAAGGPTYQFRQINPVNNQDGGEPGGNIRVGFLFRTDRGLSFVDRPGGTATAATTVVNGATGPELTFSPGRIDPGNAAFATSRKPLAGEFLFLGQRLFVIVNHFNSKSGDQPLFGHLQPPARPSEVQRLQQAQIVHDFVAGILALDADADVVVLGDLNDFEFSDAVNTLEAGVLHNLVEALPQNERYSYTFEGNAQVLDHILVSSHLRTARRAELDMVHVNSEFAAPASDHDPPVTRLSFIYAFSGFLAPVANPPTRNTVKAGQAIPVKFSLNGNQGLDIFAPGYPKSQPVSCDASAAIDPIEETVTAGASGLTYDPTTDQYIYTWKTDRGWAGTCRQLTVRLNDGTEHVAIFQFTR